MSTHLALDDALIEQARQLGKHKTRQKVIVAALQEYVRRREQLRILDLEGQIRFDAGYDYKPLRRRKPKRDLERVTTTPIRAVRAGTIG